MAGGEVRSYYSVLDLLLFLGYPVALTMAKSSAPDQRVYHSLDRVTALGKYSCP